MSRFCVSQVSTMYNDGLRAPLSLSPFLLYFLMRAVSSR